MQKSDGGDIVKKSVKKKKEEIHPNIDSLRERHVSRTTPTLPYWTGLVCLALIAIGLYVAWEVKGKRLEIATKTYEAKLEDATKTYEANLKTTEDVYKKQLNKGLEEILNQQHAFEVTLEEYQKLIIPTDVLILHLNARVDPELAKIIGKHVEENAKKFNLPVNLILSIIYAESKFNPFAVSSVGAKGLMQVYPKVHKDRINGANLFHVNENVRLGCEIFREYYDRKNGDLTKAIHAYLSENATKEELWKYKINILDAWSKLEMYYYLPKPKEEKKEEEKRN